MLGTLVKGPCLHAWAVLQPVCTVQWCRLFGASVGRAMIWSWRNLNDADIWSLSKACYKVTTVWITIFQEAICLLMYWLDCWYLPIHSMPQSQNSSFKLLFITTRQTSRTLLWNTLVLEYTFWMSAPIYLVYIDGNTCPVTSLLTNICGSWLFSNRCYIWKGVVNTNLLNGQRSHKYILLL